MPFVPHRSVKRGRVVLTLAPLAWLGALATAAPAHADDNSAVVEQLFSDGRKLMADGNVAEACPKFLASYNLDHRVGTVLSLADCYEKNKQIASAWARFLEARTLATRNNQPERADYAAKHASVLEPRRSMLTITVDRGVPGLVVQRDGSVVDPAIYGIPVPVDGGVHAITASATGKEALSASVTVAAEADQKTYAIPPFIDAVPTGPGLGVGLDTPSPSKHLSKRAIAGIAVAGGGVVLAGVGVAFGALALGKKSDSVPFCNVGGVANDCFGAGPGVRSAAFTDGTVSTVLIGVGAAAAVGGVVLWLTDPVWRGKATVGFDGRTLRLGGSF